MEVIQDILKDLEFIPIKNNDQYVGESEIYLFILEAIGLDNNLIKQHDYYTLLAVASISCQLDRQDDYDCPNFEENTIFDLLVDRDDEEYKAIFNYVFGETTYLEHHNINKIEMFFGENLKIEYDLLLDIFAKIITSDLNITLEKVKKKLISNVTIIEWSDLIIGGNGDYLEVEIERMEGIINGVLH